MPDADLLDVHGGPTTMDKARSGRPAVVVLYRGAWCPYGNMTLHTYQQELVPALTDCRTELIAISPQKPDGSLTVQQTHNLTFTVLSDPGNQIAATLGMLTAPSDHARARRRSASTSPRSSRRHEHAADADADADADRRGRGRRRHHAVDRRAPELRHSPEPEDILRVLDGGGPQPRA